MLLIQTLSEKPVLWFDPVIVERRKKNYFDRHQNLFLESDEAGAALPPFSSSFTLKRKLF